MPVLKLISGKTSSVRRAITYLNKKVKSHEVDRSARAVVDGIFVRTACQLICFTSRASDVGDRECISVDILYSKTRN